MALTKKYKPGQLVTIDNRVYRVCKAIFYEHCCVLCEYPKTYPCQITTLFGCSVTIGLHCYLKLVEI